MWVYHKRAHMTVNGRERCIGIFTEANLLRKHAPLANMMAVQGKADLVTPTCWFSLLIKCPIYCSVYCHFNVKTS